MRSTGSLNRVHEDPRDIEGAFRALACAVCEKAVSDYRQALKTGDHFKIETMEKFFRSEWFYQLSNGAVEGEAVIEEVRRQWAKQKMLRQS